MNVSNRQQIHQKQSQRIKFNQKMLFALNTFQQSYSELYDSILTEIESNPYLESFDHNSLHSASSIGSNYSDLDPIIVDSSSISLHEHLINQLEFENLEPKDHIIVEYLISHLNRNYNND